MAAPVTGERSSPVAPVRRGASWRRGGAGRAPRKPAGRLRGVAVPLGLMGVDVLALALGLVCAAPAGTAPGAREWTVLMMALVVPLNAAGGLYRVRLFSGPLHGVARLAGSGLLTAAVALAPGWGVSDPRWAWEVLVAGGVFTGAAVCGRWVFHRVSRPGEGRATLVVGGGRHAGRLVATLLAHPEYRLRPVGVVSERRAGVPGVPVLGRPAGLADILRLHPVHTVIVAGVGRAARESARVARASGCEVLFAPEPGDALTQIVPLGEHVRSFPLVRMRPLPQARPTWPLKRALDCVVAVTGLVLGLPVLIVCALALRREVGPRVLFRQERVGLDGRPVQVLKLRTYEPEDAREAAVRWSIAGDSRIGPAGRLMRRLSLDELPQFWNVLRGEMSVVGPRPERPYFVERFSAMVPGYDLRHRVPAGITGWAQVHGLRGDTSIEDRVRFDNHYIDDWSLRGDLKIMARTVWCMLRSGGA